MKYELIDAKPTVSRNMYELTVNAVPEQFLEYLKSPGTRIYHGKDKEWYQVPGFKRCTDDDLCEKLSLLYEKAKNTPELTPAPNP